MFSKSSFVLFLVPFALLLSVLWSLALSWGSLWNAVLRKRNNNKRAAQTLRVLVWFCHFQMFRSWPHGVDLTQDMFLSGIEEEYLHTKPVYLTRHLAARAEPQQLWLMVFASNVLIYEVTAKQKTVSEKRRKSLHHMLAHKACQVSWWKAQLWIFPLSCFTDMSHLVYTLWMSTLLNSNWTYCQSLPKQGWC